jgi:hypothetical protein
MRSATPDRSAPEPITTAAPAGAAEPAPSNAIARLVPLNEGFYVFTIAGGAALPPVAPGFAVPAIHISAPPPGSGALENTDIFGQPAAWLGTRHSTVFVKSPTGGGLALVTAYPARDPGRPSLSLEIRRLDAAGFDAGAANGAGEDVTAVPLPPFATIHLADPIPTAAAAEAVSLEILLHVRRRGDVRFIEAAWAGRLGPGLWIESFAILPRHRSAAAAIEYKGLTAAGVETAWLGSGSPCGSRGIDTPLVGFAVRQRSGAADTLFDCEYTGYFQSGALVGPCRNGAPCLSATANDPLEGMQLRIVERPKQTKPAEQDANRATEIGRR